MAQSLAWLVAFRAAQGLCYAAMVSIGIGMYRRIYPAHLLGSILGINALVVAGGTVAGLTVGGVIVTTMHWPWLFLINLPLGVLAISLAWRNLPADHEAGGAFDAKGRCFRPWRWWRLSWRSIRSGVGRLRSSACWLL